MRDELVGVVLALHRSRHAEVECGYHAADGKHLRQETLTEGVLRQRVAICREAQGIRRRRGRVVRKLRLYGVEHHRALGQADRGAGTTVADRPFEVALSLVNRLADAWAVDTQTRKAVLQPTDARKQSLQHVTLHLSCGVADDLPIQSWEPFGACALDVLVIRNAQNVRAAECVPSARRAKRRRYVRCPVVWRPAGLDVIGCRNPGPETPCGADGYQRSDHCD